MTFIVMIIAVQLSYCQDSLINYMNNPMNSFSVRVPESMVSKSKEIKTEVGVLRNDSYYLVGKEQSVIQLYLVNIVEYPLGSFSADSTDLINTFLLQSIVNLANSVEGEVIYSTPSSNGFFIFRIKFDEDGVIKGKAIIKNDIFYMIQAYCHKDKSLDDSIDDFLESFRIIQ